MSTEKVKKGKCTCPKAKEENVRDLPGAALNVADDCRVTKELIKERTATLDNNPHSQGL